MYDPKEREWPCLAEQVWWCRGSNDSVSTRSQNRAESWLIHMLALWLLASSLICADLNFLIYEKTVVSTFCSTAIKTEWRNKSWESNTSRQSSHLKVLNTEFVFNKNTVTGSIHTNDSIFNIQVSISDKCLPRQRNGLFVQICSNRAWLELPFKTAKWKSKIMVSFLNRKIKEGFINPKFSEISNLFLEIRMPGFPARNLRTQCLDICGKQMWHCVTLAPDFRANTRCRVWPDIEPREFEATTSILLLPPAPCKPEPYGVYLNYIRISFPYQTQANITLGEWISCYTQIWECLIKWM